MSLRADDRESGSRLLNNQNQDRHTPQSSPQDSDRKIWFVHLCENTAVQCSGRRERAMASLSGEPHSPCHDAILLWRH